MIHTIDLKFQGLDHVIAAFLIETSEGPVLVETGPYSTFEHLREGVKNTGYSLDQIRHVFLSHIHFDHAGASWALAENGANIYVHPVGKPHLASPEKLVRSATRIYGDQMDVLWGQLKPIDPSCLIPCDHGITVQIGDKKFISWHTPGHASHHIAWQLDHHLFTGDVAGIKIENGIIHPPCPPPDIDLEAWQDSIILIRSLPVQHLYLTHFGKIDNISRHLDALEKSLLDWAEWIRPFAESNTEIDQITPKFQKYVAEQLRHGGLTEKGIQQYEAANPSWMSVSGLMRYWNKKNIG